MTCRSGLLAAWANAWLRGLVGTSEVTDAVGGTGVQDALLAWRKAGDPVRLVLPVAGDVRGLPGPSGFRDAAIAAGEAVVGGELGLLPIHADHWRGFEIDAVPDDFVQLSEAQYDLTTAIRETASELRRVVELPRKRAVPPVETTAGPQALSAARRAGERLDLPRGFPAPAVALIAQAERMQAVLDLAPPDLPALRDLAVAVRRARVAGYNANSNPTATA